MTEPQDITPGSNAGNATKTSGVLTKASLRLQARELKARKASAASTVAPSTIPTNRPGPKTRRKLPTAQDLERIAVMRSQGLPVTSIAAGLQIHYGSVQQALKDPGVIGQIAVYRERLRGTNLVAADAIAQKAWQKAESALDADDAKSWDAYTRGIHAMEKVAASASGENQKVELSGTVTTVSEPVKIQLQQLIALVRDGANP